MCQSEDSKPPRVEMPALSACCAFTRSSTRRDAHGTVFILLTQLLFSVFSPSPTNTTSWILSLYYQAVTKAALNAFSHSSKTHIHATNHDLCLSREHHIWQKFINHKSFNRKTCGIPVLMRSCILNRMSCKFFSQVFFKKQNNKKQKIKTNGGLSVLSE